MEKMSTDDIIKKQQEILGKLSPEERKMALDILGEYSKIGESEVLKELLDSDYAETPADISTFLHDKKYLGNALYDQEGRFTLFPYWEEKLKEVFPDRFTTAYNTIVLTGAIGLGKSTVAVICLLYMLHRLLCLKDPYLYYGLQPIDKISISLMNITLENAKGVALDKMNQMILSSEWFLAHGQMSGVSNLMFVPDKHIELITASSNNQVIGRAIFCLDGETVIKTDLGDYALKSLVGKDIKVISVDNCGNESVSGICTVKPTIMTNEEYEIILDDGTVIECTGNHSLMLKDGTYKKAEDLTLEDVLMAKQSESECRLASVKRVILDATKQFYDVIEANPYNNFLLKTNSGYIVSHNCNFTDEVNFGLTSDVEKLKKKQKQLISQIDARMKSRFMRERAFGTYLPTLNIIASSKNSEQSFLEDYIETKKKNESKTTLIVDEPQWVVDSRKDSPEKFYVAIGNRFLANELLPLNPPKDLIDEYRAKGYTMLAVPIGYRENFEDNIDGALTDIAGIATAASLKYISGVRWNEIKTARYENPFTKEIIEVGTAKDDNLQYYNFFDLSKVSDEMRAKPLYVHLDMSRKGDKTGIAGVYVLGKKPKVEGEDSSREMFYRVAFNVSVKAPKGYEISFDKNRIFIRWLREKGFNINGISCFKGDTLISTPIGLRKIKDIAVGDIVYAFDDATNKITEARVYNAVNNGPRTDFIKVWISDEDFIECTPEHRIKTQRGYIMAKDIKDDDLVDVDAELFYKQKLLRTGFFVDNEFLDEYVKLVASRKDEQTTIGSYSEKHHIIPRCIFKHMGKAVDNSELNIVKLSFSDHVNAHYLLAKCCVPKVLHDLSGAVTKMLGNKHLDKNGIENFLNNASLQEHIEEIKALRSELLSKKMIGNHLTRGRKHTDEEKQRISASNKKPHGIHPRSEFKIGGTTWNKGVSYLQLYSDTERKNKFRKNNDYIWISDGKSEYQILKTDIIPDGFVPNKRLPVSEETRIKMSEARKGVKVNMNCPSGYRNYTNGKCTIRVFPGEEIPEGFWHGRTFDTTNSKKRGFLYSDKFKSLNAEEYKKYYLDHTTEETMERFNISEANHKKFCRFYNIKKGKR